MNTRKGLKKKKKKRENANVTAYEVVWTDVPLSFLKVISLFKSNERLNDDKNLLRVLFWSPFYFFPPIL